MTMYGEGDVAGIIELLRAIDKEPDEGDMSSAELLRYQDPLDVMKTGLHIAIEKSQQEAAWLLLWLASELPTSSFPDEIARSAAVLGAGRETARGADIRSLRDAAGRTAGDVAESMGPIWTGLINAGVLKP